ncbi:unnamed protein product [Durusdinium trenchii]|uniref:Pheophorbide a oxygenase domain-containing protein n=1 Tax=Durusdinium trenchii TaxID=1381693 RepID=A0ABP0H5V1_9DINO
MAGRSMVKANAQESLKPTNHRRKPDYLHVLAYPCCLQRKGTVFCSFGQRGYTEIRNHQIIKRRRDKPQLQASGVVSYKAPNHVWSLTDRKDSYRDWNIVYAAPICPGRSRIFVRVVFEVPKVPMPLRQIFQVVFSPSLPPWVTHLLNHNVLEDDNVFLHYQGETMAPDGKQDAKWQERFYTPTSSDAAVLCYHRWLQDVGGGVHWARDPSTSIKRKGREELLERLHSHTDHCWSCSEALALSQMLQSWGRPLLLLASLDPISKVYTFLKAVTFRTHTHTRRYTYILYYIKLY